jgi:hypothetical protein
MKTGLEVFWSGIADELNPPPVKQAESIPDVKPKLHLLPVMDMFKASQGLDASRYSIGTKAWIDHKVTPMRAAHLRIRQQTHPDELATVHAQVVMAEEVIKSLGSGDLDSIVRDDLARRLAQHLKPLLKVSCRQDLALNCSIYYTELTVFDSLRNEQSPKRWFRDPTN